jgi:PKD repeat protein
LSRVGLGTHNITYRHTTDKGCESSVNRSVTINEATVVSLGTFYGVLGQYNTSSLPDTLILEPAFSFGRGRIDGNGINPFINDTLFIPAFQNIRPDTLDTLRYIVTSDLGCIDTALYVYTVSENVAQIVGFTKNTYCSGEAPVELVALNFGTEVTEWINATVNPMDPTRATFYPASALISGAEIEVSFKYRDGAQNGTKTNSVTVYETPIFTVNSPFDQDTTFCLDHESISLDNGNLFTPFGPSSSLRSSSNKLINSTSYLPANNLTVGVDTLFYSFTKNHNVISCSADTFKLFTIYDLPIASFVTVPTQFCKNDDDVTLRALPNVNGAGVFTSTVSTNSLSNAGSINGEINYLVGSSDVAAAIDVIIYTFTSDNGCVASTQLPIVIDTVPIVSISNLATEYCEGDIATIQGLVGGQILTTGTSIFTSQTAHLVDNGDGTALIDGGQGLGIQYPQVFDVIYSYTDLNNCSASTVPVLSVVDSVPIASLSFEGGREHCSHPSNVIQLFPTRVGGLITFNGEPLNILNPKAVLSNIGDNPVVFTINSIDNPNCIGVYRDTLIVHSTPVAKMNNLLIDKCIADSVQFVDESTTDLGEQIRNWTWDFGSLTDANDTSSLENPKYLYPVKGTKLITLLVESEFGCLSNQASFNVTFFDNPEANFTWVNECVNVGPTQFMNSSLLKESSGVQYEWNFDVVGGVTGTSTEENPVFQYPNSTNYTVQLVVSSVSGCTDTVIQTIYVRPFERFETEDIYSQDFELSDGAWKAEAVEGSSLSWELATIINSPDVIQNAFSGERAWVTNPSGDYNLNENSWVSSPCFNLDNLDKPMLKMNLQTAITDLNDGVNVQYLYSYLDSNNDTLSSPWKNLGEVGTGISWFNSTTIDANPGDGSGRGWTGVSKIGNDSTWIDVRRSLDFLKDISSTDSNVVRVNYVRFRIAFASDGQRVGSGVAFDDVWIGNRQKILLHEYFTNSSSSDCKITDVLVDRVISDRSSPQDIVDLQFHTGSPLFDPMNAVNPEASSARENNYTVPSVPYSAYGGNLFLGNTNEWVSDSSQILLDALLDPKFLLNLGVLKTDNTIDIQIDLEANADMEINPHVYIAFVEKTVSAIGQNGDTEFRNVVRHILPYQGALPVSWSRGDVVRITMSWQQDFFDDNSDIAVVAFIQDIATDVSDREVLQVGYSEDMNSALGFSAEAELSSFSVYPNPTLGALIISIKEKNDVTVELFDQRGNLILVKSINSASSLEMILPEEYSNGVYLLKVYSDKEFLGTKKIVLYR